jgi:uncharacterized membrane-anchored protein
MKTEKTTELIKHMLDCLESPCRELTKWEQDFVESVGTQFAERGSLSDRQFEILENIYAEKTA